MRTALMLDHERLTQEQPMFNRLCVALLADGIHAVRVVPSTFDQTRENPEERRIALLPRVDFRPASLPWIRRARIGKLADDLDRLGAQVVHAAGRTTWPMAIGVGAELERPVVLGVWSLAEAEAARHHRRSGVGAWLTPSERIAAPLRAHVDRALVHVVPAGVPVGALPPECAAPSAHGQFIVGIGEGLDLRAWDRFLTAARRVLDEPGMDQVQIALEVRGPRGHDIWRKVRDLDLLSRVCSFGEASEHRTLLLRGRGLCLPEPMVAMRTIVLEAMAQGVPVAAVETPVLDEFDDDQGLARVAPPGPDTWSAALRRLLTDPGSTGEMCRVAWQRIHRTHRSSQQASGVASVYRTLMHGDALPFDAHTRTNPARPK